MEKADERKYMGITPIYMGSTGSHYWAKGLPKDHPHIHGEHGSTTMFDTLDKGSPPYTWGALVANRCREIGNGITPIYMGSTVEHGRWLGLSGDHPHIHGEHISLQTSRMTPAGSPPYTWGAHELLIAGRARSGITPIYMGSTLRRATAFDSGGDHPHIHGEHLRLPPKQTN